MAPAQLHNSNQTRTLLSEWDNVQKYLSNTEPELLHFKHWTNIWKPELLWVRMGFKWLIISSITIESLWCLLDTLFVFPCELVPSAALSQTLVMSSLFKATAFKNKKIQLCSSDGFKLTDLMNWIYITCGNSKGKNKETGLADVDITVVAWNLFFFFSLLNQLFIKKQFQGRLNYSWVWAELTEGFTWGRSPPTCIETSTGDSARDYFDCNKTLRFWARRIKASLTKGHIQP